MTYKQWEQEQAERSRERAEDELLRIRKDLDNYRQYGYGSDHHTKHWGTPRYQTEETKMSDNTELEPMSQADQWFLGFVLAILLAAMGGLGVWFYYEPMALLFVGGGMAVILGVFLLGKIAYFLDLADQKRKIKKRNGVR